MKRYEEIIKSVISLISELKGEIKILEDSELPIQDPIPTPPTSNGRTPLTGVVDIKSLGVLSIDSQISGYIFKDSYHKGLTIENVGTKDYYLIYCDQIGNISYPNILTNGLATSFQVASKGAHILKITNGIFSLEKAISSISGAELNKYDFTDCYVFIPSGTYIHLMESGTNTFWYIKENQPLRIIGGDNTTLLGLNDNLNGELNKIDSKVENLTMHNIIPSTGDAQLQKNYFIKDVTLNYHSLTNSGTYLIFVNSVKSSIYCDNLVINADNDVYIPLMVYSADNVVIINTKINTKFSTHGIRVNDFVGSCIITDNYVENSTTGILVSTQRKRLLKNVSIQRNNVANCTEESISIDAFGNNTSLVPVITKSKIKTINDWVINSRIVGKIIDLKYLNFVETTSSGYGKDIVNADFVDDPTEFLFLIDSGELKYTNSLVESYEVINYDDGINGLNTTLRLFIKANFDTSRIKEDDEVALLTGAYNCNISDNIVSGAIPASGQPGHGISLWGGGYYCQIRSNVVDGCKQGLNVAGFGSFGLTNPEYFNYAIGNNIDGNTFNNCLIPFELKNFFGSGKGYANKFNNNNAFMGKFGIDSQELLQFNNNVFVNCEGTIDGVVLGSSTGNIKSNTTVTVTNSEGFVV